MDGKQFSSKDVANESIDQMREKIDATRAQLSSKIEAFEDRLEKKVEQTIDHVAARLEQGVDTVTSKVESTIVNVTQSVDTLVGNLKESFNLTRHIEEHPFAMLGIAVVAGTALGGLLPGAILTKAAGAQVARHIAGKSVLSSIAGSSTVQNVALGMVVSFLSDFFKSTELSSKSSDETGADSETDQTYQPLESGSSDQASDYNLKH